MILFSRLSVRSSTRSCCWANTPPTLDNFSSRFCVTWVSKSYSMRLVSSNVFLLMSRRLSKLGNLILEILEAACQGLLLLGLQGLQGLKVDLVLFRPLLLRL